MEITVDNTSIDVSIFDNEETILVKYALEIGKESLPGYFYIRTKDFHLKDGSRLKVRDIRSELKDLDPEKFFRNLEELHDKYQHMSKFSITLLFLSKYNKNTLEESLKENRELIKQLSQVDTRLFSPGAILDAVSDYKRNVEKERERLRKNLRERMRINKTLVSLEKKSVIDTRPFTPEGISIEIPIDLANGNSLPGIFDMMETSKKVPYVVLLYRRQIWVKTYRHICPVREWIVRTKNINTDGPDRIIFWVLNSQSQTSGKDITKFYSIGSWNLQNKVEITIDAKKTQNDLMKSNLLSSLGDRIEYSLLPEKEVKIKGTFIVNDIIFNRLVFSDMIMNNETVNYFFFMNEKEQSVSDKKRYWIYYSPKQSGDIEDSLTITITPESDEILGYWIEVRISRAKTLQEIDYFIRVFSAVLELYKKESNRIIGEYGKIMGKNEAEKIFRESIKEQTAKKTDKKTGKRLKALKMAKPDMVRSNYTCQKPRQPYFVESQQKADKFIEKRGSLGKYKIMEYPYKSGEYYACEPREPEDKGNEIYPGLITNTDGVTEAEYPLVPCCFKNNNYKKDSKNAVPSQLMLYLSRAKELEKSGIKDMSTIHLEAARSALDIKKSGSKDFYRPLDSKKILDMGRYGVIPYYIQEIAKRAKYENIQYYDKNILPLLTYGVLHSPDSFIHCLERAFNPEYKTLNLKDKISQVKTIRRKWAGMNFSIAKQELYDFSREDIINLLSSEEHYIDPAMFISLASEYYNCNIFLYEISSKHPHGCVVIPRFSQAYLLKDITETKDTVFIIRRTVKNYPYPYQCEIIVEIEDSENKREFNPVIENVQFIEEAIKVLNNSNTVYIVTKEGSFYYSPVNITSNIFRGAISQVIDENGKTRRLNYKSGVTLMTSPLPPLSLPIDDKMFEVTRDVAETFIKKKNLEITYQDGDEHEGVIQGLWIRSKIHNSGLYYGYIPLKLTESYPSIPFSSSITEDPSGGTQLSELKVMKKNRKTAELIQAYTLYEYSRLDEDDKGKINDLFFIDENHQYDIHTLGEVIEENNDVIYSLGKIIIPSEDVKDRLIFYINHKLLNDPETVKNYKDSKIIKNYYSRIDDFRKRPEEVIFSSPIAESKHAGLPIETSLDRWTTSTKRNTRNRTIFSKWNDGEDTPFSPGWDQLKTDPYFFRNSNIRSGKMAIIQNVKSGSLEQALYVAVKWLEGDKEYRMNVGYNPQVEKSDIKGHAYVIYHENGDKPEKIEGEGKRAFVIEYNNKKYGAVLFL